MSSSSPELLNPEDLLTGRRGLGFRSVTNSSIGEESEEDSVTDSYFEFGKRKRASKRPNLSYQGRNAHKGEGQHTDVKVKGKGDGLDGDSQVMDSIVEVVETVEKEAEDLGVVVDDDVESVNWEEKVAEVERQRGKLLPERDSIGPNLIRNGDSCEPTTIEVSLQQNAKYPENDIIRNDSPHSRHSSVSSASSKRSSREAGRVSIVTVQDYRASSSLSKAADSRTHTPLRRSTPSDKQSHSNVKKSNSRRTSLTGLELTNYDNSSPNEPEEIQVNAINEHQELVEDLNEREDEFITQSQIHVDISYGNDEQYDDTENNVNEENVDLPDKTVFAEVNDTQNAEEPLMSPTDQNSYFTESENEDEIDWAGKETIGFQQNNETEDKLTVEETVRTGSPDDTSQLVSTNEIAEADSDDKENVLTDTHNSFINTEEISAEPSTDAVQIEVVDGSEKVQDEVEVVMQENLIGRGLCTLFCYLCF